jgi:mannose-6-phosphate isomerase-like protein (cupin superfamily)
MHVLRANSATVKYEYGCDLRRLYPWHGVADPAWGSAIASVRPGEATTPHAHDESETFIVLSGRGRMEIDAESEELQTGDVVLIPKNSQHRFQNLSEREPLVFISIFWDSPEAREKTQGRLVRGVHDI